MIIEHEEVNMAEDDNYVFLNSCASNKLFILRDQSYLESLLFRWVIQTTSTSVQLSSLGYKDLTDTVRQSKHMLSRIITWQGIWVTVTESVPVS